MKSRAFLGLLTIGALLSGSCRGSYQGTSGYYRIAELDPKSRKLRVSDSLGLNAPEYRAFFGFTVGFGRQEISDCEPDQHICYNLFSVEADDHLSYRTKYLRLLSGPYATVYGKVEYFYAERYSKHKNSFETTSYANSLRQVLPVVYDRGEGVEQTPLSAISLVRILRAQPEFLIASANYSSDGHLYALSVNGAKDGSWVGSNQLRIYAGKFGTDTMIGDDRKTREYFGIPATFPVSDYLAGKAVPFTDLKLDAVLDAVNLHYDESRVVRQDIYAPGKERITSFLRYPQTKEDDALRDIDRERGFADIEYTREKPKP